MTIRTMTLIVSIDDKIDEFRDDLEAAIKFHQELQGEPFLLVHVLPGIMIPGQFICDQHKALKK